MTDKEMRLELEENQVKDNPFDVMLYHSLELTRDLMFACHRLKNPEVPQQICTNENSLYSYINKIMKEFLKLINMSDETVAMLRETSYYYQQDEFNKMNDILLEFERNMESSWTRCTPSRNDRFEQIRLGIESDKYKRLIQLRNIITESEDLSSMDDSYLQSLCDVIHRPDYCVPSFMTQKEFDQKQEIIKKYELSEEDVEYMISYRNSKNKYV